MEKKNQIIYDELKREMEKQYQVKINELARKMENTDLWIVRMLQL